MKTYVILLRRMEAPTRPVSLTRPGISEIAESNGVLLLDVLTFVGIFDAAVTRRAPNHDATRLRRSGWLVYRGFAGNGSHSIWEGS